MPNKSQPAAAPGRGERAWTWQNWSWRRTVHAIVLAPAQVCLQLSAALLLVITGCSSGGNEQDGHEEPRLGRYRAVVNVTFVEFTLEPAKESLSARVELKAECENTDQLDRLPPNCDQNVPGWIVRKPDGATFLTASIDNPSAPETGATINLNVPQYLEQYGKDLSSLGEHWFLVGFVPSSIPPGLTISGSHDLKVIVKAAEEVPREEQPPDKPRLTANSTLPIFLMGELGESESGDLRVSYSGPATTVTKISVSGIGAANFQVTSPSVPSPVTGNRPLHVNVVFQVPHDDWDERKALLTIETANGQTCPVFLLGQRKQY